MASSSYGEALARVLAHEGGYTNNPADPGGPTNFGITLDDYRRYAKPGATAADVKAMNVEEAKSIYRTKYWDAQRCDELSAGVDYAVFDYGVNSGIGRSKKVLQRVLGVTADGAFGPRTMHAAASADPRSVIVALCDERLRFLQGLRTWPVFGRGWGRRVAEVKQTALAMAAQARPAAAQPNRVAPGRAVVPQPKAAQRASSGAVVAAGAVAVQQAQRSGVGAVGIVGIAIVAIAAAAGAWLLWRWRRQRMQEQPA